MVTKVKLTMAQAVIRYLCAQRIHYDGHERPLFKGVFGIFGHGNVAGLGQALQDAGDALPVYRAHNEQAMAHTAIAYSKAKRRHQIMICTTSVGPGATNMVTAAALAHVNRLPVLLLPGDTFANRLPDPVLQQLENFSNPTVSANDCFQPVSRYWDRITRPEQVLQSLPQAISVLLDPVDCGPVTLALPQDVQAEAYDYPITFFDQRTHRVRRPRADTQELETAISLIHHAERPLIVAGGGVHYSDAADLLGEFAARHQIPVSETQAGKGSLAWDHPCNVGSIGVTGSSAANRLAVGADLIIAIGTRLQDFTTGSNLLIGGPDCSLLSINVSRHDLGKRMAVGLCGDARQSLEDINTRLENTNIHPDWTSNVSSLREEWDAVVTKITALTDVNLPTDAEVIGVVNRRFSANATVVCAAGGLPGELHKLWRATDSDSYHAEYGFSCMGYEIAGGLGVKMAHPDRDIVVMVGDGSYLMLNSEIASSVAMAQKLIIIVLNNRGFGCINRLQTSLGGKAYNNLLESSYLTSTHVPDIDFVQHAASLGAYAIKATGLSELDEALRRAQQADRTSVVVIDTDPQASTDAGGTWWDVPVAEVSGSDAVKQAYKIYDEYKQKR